MTKFYCDTYDNITLGIYPANGEHIKCPNCASKELTSSTKDKPFWADPSERGLLVIPMGCDICDYEWSIHLSTGLGQKMPRITKQE